jgi:hypothetical protein
MDSSESLVEIDLGVTPEASISGAVLLQSEEKAFLTFNAMRDSDRPFRLGEFTGFYKESAGTAVIELVGCVITKFGYPNDEGLPEHPLYSFGLADASSSILEVVGSAWASDVAAQLRASSERIWRGRGMKLPDTHRAPGRHFIVLLKEQTFECIATTLTVRHYAKDFAEAYSYVQKQLAEH